MEGLLRHEQVSCCSISNPNPVNPQPPTLKLKSLHPNPHSQTEGSVGHTLHIHSFCVIFCERSRGLPPPTTTPLNGFVFFGLLVRAAVWTNWTWRRCNNSCNNSSHEPPRCSVAPRWLRGRGGGRDRERGADQVHGARCETLDTHSRETLDTQVHGARCETLDTHSAQRKRQSVQYCNP